MEEDIGLFFVVVVWDILLMLEFVVKKECFVYGVILGIFVDGMNVV